MRGEKINIFIIYWHMCRFLCCFILLINKITIVCCVILVLWFQMKVFRVAQFPGDFFNVFFFFAASRERGERFWDIFVSTCTTPGRVSIKWFLFCVFFFGRRRVRVQIIKTWKNSLLCNTKDTSALDYQSTHRVNSRADLIEHRQALFGNRHLLHHICVLLLLLFDERLRLDKLNLRRRWDRRQV